MPRVIPRPPLPPGPFLVVGLARSGVAAARLLRERGEAVVGCDAGGLARGVREELEATGVEVHERTEGTELVAAAASVVKSPGVPQEAPVVVAARAAGRAVIGELELAWRLLPNEVVAVTGSNGKTTTVELLGHIHRAAGLPVAVAGNVGTPLATLPGRLAADATVVAEASSFQLEDTAAFAPEAAVLLNLAEDHLDRHKTLAAYRAAKLQAFARQPQGTVAVLPADFAVDDVGGAARRVRFGDGEGFELALDGDTLRWLGEPLIAAGDVALRGPHNLRNAMAAAAVALARGVPTPAVREGLGTFAGVAHRLEEIATRDGVLYVNDSKATNVDAAVTGIRSFPGGVHVILGGRGKGGAYAGLAEPVRERCVAAYLIGETAAVLRDALAPTGVPLHDCGDLPRAVAAARAAARPGDVVLLSPACTSYDQYANFEERGEHFRALARA
jgi:UDP-N-acetylmuramoylalanine--D-glutamate ligase